MQITPGQQRAIGDLCRRYRVRTLKMFGSAAIGRETVDSDVDLLVTFTPGRAPTAFEVVDLRDALSLVFDGRPVDLACASILANPYRRRVIDRRLRPLYPASARE